MKQGDLVRHMATNKKFYVVLCEKKYDNNYKPRVQVVSAISTKKHWFLEEELEVLNGNDQQNNFRWLYDVCSSK